MGVQDEAERLHADSREQWRAWLAENHATARSVWLVSWRSSVGRPAVTYEDAVCEAVCFGWIDSTQRPVDQERTMLYFARRKPGSGWSRSNKQRIELLEREGRMTQAGRDVIEAAKADGSWTLLDDVENLVIPADLAAAFDRYDGSRAQWEAFPRSAKRAALEWIVQAKRPATRERRVDETAAAAAKGKRAT